MIKQHYLNHSQIDVYFKQSKDDFVVTEVPLYEFSGEGEHLILKIRKKDLSTWDALQIISDTVGCKNRDIGYAGLKDKNAMTVQYISIHKSFEDKVDAFSHPQIKILEKTYHNNKIKIGHLKGNKFFIRLKRVQPMHRMKLESALEQIVTFGMPNYFGFQRFGHDGVENLEKARRYIYEDLTIKDRKLSKMLVAAYQSDFFNKWLVNRLNLSDESFKAMDGDVFRVYETDRFFTPKNLTEVMEKDFKAKKIVPTGLLPGRKAFRSIGKAREIEENFDDSYIQEKGYRRDAIVYPTNIKINYNKQTQKCKVRFTLPKGSYATVLIENIANRNLKA